LRHYYRDPGRGRIKHDVSRAGAGARFRIADEHGAEIGRVLRVPPGLAGMFTTAIHHPLEEPLLSLAVVSAVCVDLALSQLGPVPA